MLRVRWSRIVLILAWLVGCSDCEDRAFEPPPKAEPKRTAHGPLDNPAVPTRARPQAPSADAPPPLTMPPAAAGPDPELGPGMLHPGLLARFLPDTLGDFAATGEAQRRINVRQDSEAQLPNATRLYRRDDVYSKVQLLDARAFANLRDPVLQLQGTKRSSANAKTEGRKVGAYPATLQWTLANHTARISLVLEDRIVVNLSVAPCDDLAQAETLIQKLDLIEIAKAAAFATEATERAAHPDQAGPAKATADQIEH